MNVMTIISVIMTVIILGILYWRMVKREIPEPIGWQQALIPIAIGIVSFPITVPFSMGLMKAMGKDPNALKLTELNFFQALWRDLILAGGLEEIAKLLMILVVLFIFRNKVKNVYEFILIGACVGIGFTIAEEYYYGSDEGATILSTVLRLIAVPAHMTFNMVMAEFLGRARISKLSGKGSPVIYCLLAILVPITVHTLYDVTTAFNSGLMRGEMKGFIVAAIGYVCLLVYELVVLIRCKKKTAEFCSMRTL